MKVKIILSETWHIASLADINFILNETILDFISIDERIINIETKTDDSGLSRFWIYVAKDE